MSKQSPATDSQKLKTKRYEKELRKLQAGTCLTATALLLLTSPGIASEPPPRPVQPIAPAPRPRPTPMPSIPRTPMPRPAMRR